MDNGWIKLYFKILDWQWYQDTNAKCLFLHCILKANWKDNYFMGTLIKRGEFATSYKTLSKELKLTIDQIRLARKKLEISENITITRHSKFLVISVVNYELFQQKPQSHPNHIPITSQQSKKNKNTKEVIKVSNSNNKLLLVEQVVGYMNELAQTNYKKSTKKTIGLINARLAEGFLIEDFKDVIYFKYNEWFKEPIKFNNGIMSNTYFRPNTLFGTKFEEYLEEYRRTYE